MPQADSKSHDSSTPQTRAHDHPDDLIVVPKGRSKKQFYLTLGLMLFVLLVFTVGGAFETSVGGLFGDEESNPVHLAWTDPTTQIRHEVPYDVFQKRHIGLDTLHSIGAFQPRHVPEGKRPRVSDEDAGLVLVLDQMARDAGIEVSDGEFTQFLLNSFQTGDNVRRLARQRRMTVPSLEALLRDHLRVAKLMSFLAMGASLGADAGDVEELWKEDHPQYAFQYAEVEGAQYLDQARADLPTDEELLEWFHTRPFFEQQRHFSDESFSGIVAYASLDEPFDAATLLERFPAPEGLDPGIQARSYYNRFNNVRFKNEVPAQDDPALDEGESAPVDDAAEENDTEDFPAPAAQDSEQDADQEQDGEDVAQDDATAGVGEDAEPGDESGADEPQEVPLYKPYDEVSEQCLREAPLHAALTAWFADLRTRMSAAPEDAPLDFASEAEAVGLTVARIDEPLTRSELEEQEGWGGKFLSNQFTYALEGDLLSSVILEEGAIVAGQLTSRVARQEPPIDQIREAVGEEWAQERAVNLAVETLEALRDGLGERPTQEAPDDGSADDSAQEPEDEPADAPGPQDEPAPWLPSADEATFKALLDDAGFQMVERPWLEQYEVPGDDYDAMSAADKAIRVSPDWFGLEPGQVPAAVADAANTHAILVRFSGKRDRPIEDMTAIDLLRLRQRVAGQKANALGESLFRFDSEWFKERFQVDFRPWDPSDEEAATEEDPAADSTQ